MTPYACRISILECGLGVGGRWVSLQDKKWMTGTHEKIKVSLKEGWMMGG
jgi:hypothetical protein